MIQIMRLELSHLFDSGRQATLTAGESLFISGESVHAVYLVQAGEVHLIRHTQAGHRLILHRVLQGMIVAEDSAYATHYHCDAISPDGAILKALPKRRFLSCLAKDTALAELWAATLARATQAARLKAEIRSLHRLADRLDAWLDAGNSLPEKGNRQNVAAELGVTREALYRELAKRGL